MPAWFLPLAVVLVCLASLFPLPSGVGKVLLFVVFVLALLVLVGTLT